jgi:paraquat-inducible protein B
MVDSLNRIMDTVSALDIGRTLRDAEQAMEAFTSMSRKLEGEVGGLQLAQTSTELRALLADIKAKLDDFPAERLGADAGQVLKSLNEMSAQMRDAAAKLESSPILSKKAAQSIINDAQATATNLRELSESLRENPGQLIFGRPKKPAQQPRR